MNAAQIILIALYSIILLLGISALGMVFYSFENDEGVKRKDGEPGLVYFIRCQPVYIYYFIRGSVIAFAFILWDIYQNVRYLVTGEQSKRFKDNE